MNKEELIITSGWYTYILDYMILDHKNFKNIPTFKNKKIITNIDIYHYIFISSPISNEFRKLEYLINIIIDAIIIKCKETYINLIDSFSKIKDILETITITKISRLQFYRPIDLNKPTHELIDLLYETTSELDPDQDTFKINWDTKFDLNIEKESYVLDDSDINDILTKMKPIVPKLELYHISYTTYFQNIYNMLDEILKSLNA